MITTSRLSLRFTKETDAQFIFELMNSPDWIHNIGDRGITTVEDAKNYIIEKQIKHQLQHGYGNYLISANGIPVGCCGIYNRPGLEHCDLGFALLPQYYGNGYATEAGQAVLKEGIRNHGLRVLHGITLPTNTASQGVLVKLGFKQIGTVTLPQETTELLLFEYRV